MEFLVDLSIRHGWEHCAWFAADGMAKTPLIVDATSHLFGAKNRHTLDGDDRNKYDHNIVLGAKLLMENSGVVICRAPPDTNTVKDEFGREHLPRPRPVDMCCTLRPVYENQKGCAQYMHWQDIEAAYLSIGEGERPEYIIVSVDNGSGYDPTDELGTYYAAKFAEKYGIKMLAVLSYAAGQSALHYFVERQWSQFKKANNGMRYGQKFLRGPDGDLEGRRAPTAVELPHFSRHTAQEMADIYEENVAMS